MVSATCRYDPRSFFTFSLGVVRSWGNFTNSLAASDTVGVGVRLV